MKVQIKSPVLAYAYPENEVEKKILIKKFEFQRTSIRYGLDKLKKNKWFKKKNPLGWEAAVKDLESKLNGNLVTFNPEEKAFEVRPGLLFYMDNVNVVSNDISYPNFKPYPWAKKPAFEPYPYQVEAEEKLIKEKHGAISLPTGCGKSYILLKTTRDMGLKTVIVTPSESIFQELYRDFNEALGSKYVGRFGDGKKEINKPVTIAIGKSLSMIKAGSKEEDFFKNKDLLLVDESHTFGAEQLETVCHGVLSDIPYRFFVSATQTRGDGTEMLLQSIIGKVVLEMEIKDAIDRGYLCPLHFKIIKTFSPSTLYTKDPLECKREHFLYNNNIAEYASKIANSAWTVKQESTLILVEELVQIQMLSNLLKVPFSYVHSASKKEAAEYGLKQVNTTEEVARFNEGKVKVLIGTKAIATGTNLYPTHHVINWCGGSSEIMTKQGAMGRSTRKLEISRFKDLHNPKPYSTIYDFHVEGQHILSSMFKKRINFYKESGGSIVVV